MGYCELNQGGERSNYTQHRHPCPGEGTPSHVWRRRYWTKSPLFWDAPCFLVLSCLDLRVFVARLLFLLLGVCTWPMMSSSRFSELCHEF